MQTLADLPDFGKSELSQCCSDCSRFARPASRLERWRFGALKRLVKAKVIRRDRDRYNYSPTEAATELALFLGVQPPTCWGSAWAFLEEQYDPKATPPHKSTVKADRRRLRGK